MLMFMCYNLLSRSPTQLVSSLHDQISKAMIEFPRVMAKVYASYQCFPCPSFELDWLGSVELELELTLGSWHKKSLFNRAKLKIDSIG